MKKLRFLLVFVLAAALLAPAALADLIIEPRDDLFYFSHRDECQYLPRSYTANGAEGYVTLYDSPGSLIEKENMANGETFCCDYLFTDGAGEIWGAVAGDGWGETRGWVKLSQCRVVPDYISFEEAHGEEFTGFDSAYANALDGVETVVLWAYPGSNQVVSDRVDASWFRDGGLSSHFSTCYTDPEGNFWGYVGYCYGFRNTWLCISAPSDSALETIPDILPAQEEAIPPADALPLPTSVWMAVGLVAAVVAGTAVLIWALHRRKSAK